ncbi:FitA-like ribbon-helix-helix domain-containing protein [Pseudomonas protegens]|uniref:FitA-like ribbon-helix-helix domain-containing protein n=1 Tax=Pseudomonas protegens TaxID=380021 RepID=UPI00320B43F7
MARLSVRDFPDNLHQLLLQSAARHERSLEGETRFGLTRYLESLKAPQPEAASMCDSWQRATGQRLQKLFTRLREDNFFSWYERSDLPHLALALGEPSPATLMNCVDGLEALSFDLAKRIANHYSCSLEWLINGSGSMFPYPEVGGEYHGFFEPVISGSGLNIKLVRLCTADDAEGNPSQHDGTLLMFRCRDDKLDIASGYSGRFYLNGHMGGGGHGNLASFVNFLNENKNLQVSEYNCTAPIDSSAMWDHHPNYYLDSKHCSRASWLYPLRAGRSPSSIDWMQQHAYTSPLQKINYFDNQG